MKHISCTRILLLCCIATVLQAEYCAKPNILNSFYPQLERNNHFWLRTDLLWFHPKEKSIVLTNKPTNLFTTANVTLQPPLKTHLKGNIGYRIGFGYLFSDCLWDMTLNLTHFNTHTSQCTNTHNNIGLGIFPIWSLACDILPFDWVSQAKLHWNLKLNLLDLDFGRAFSLRNNFSIRISFGLRLSRIKQNLAMQYGGGIFANGLNLAALDSTFGYDTICMHNNCWGIGPRIGIEPQYDLGCGFRIYTSLYGTLNAALFDLHQKETYLKTVRYERCCSPTHCRGILDATAGIMWERCFHQNLYAFIIAFGWEYHLFFKQLELKGDRFGLVSHNRNLSLNGLACSARLDF